MLKNKTNNESNTLPNEMCCCTYLIILFLFIFYYTPSLNREGWGGPYFICFNANFTTCSTGRVGCACNI